MRNEKKYKNSTQFESGYGSGFALLRLSGSVLALRNRNTVPYLFSSMLHTFYNLLSVCVESRCLNEVPEELGESNELQPGADHGRRDHVVHEEGAGVRQEDAVPP